jgi:hypothetical protein
VAMAAVQRAAWIGVVVMWPCPIPRMTVDPEYQAPPRFLVDSGVPSSPAVSSRSIPVGCPTPRAVPISWMRSGPSMTPSL